MKQKTKKIISLLIILPLITSLFGIITTIPITAEEYTNEENEELYEDYKEFITSNIPAVEMLTGNELSTLTEIDGRMNEIQEEYVLRDVMQPEEIELGFRDKLPGYGISLAAGGLITIATGGIGGALLGLGSVVGGIGLTESITERFVADDGDRYEAAIISGLEVGINQVMRPWHNWNITPDHNDYMNKAMNHLERAINIYTETDSDEIDESTRLSVKQELEDMISYLNIIESNIVTEDGYDFDEREEEVEAIQNPSIIIGLDVGDKSVDNAYQEIREELDEAEITEDWSRTLRRRIDQLEEGIDYAKEKGINVRNLKGTYQDAIYYAEKRREERALEKLDDGLNSVYNEVYYEGRSRINSLKQLNANERIIQEMESDLEQGLDTVDTGDYSRARQLFESVFDDYRIEYELLHTDLLDDLSLIRDQIDDVDRLIERMSGEMDTSEYLSDLDDIRDEVDRGEERIGQERYDSAYNVLSEARRELDDLEDEIRSKETTEDELEGELDIEDLGEESKRVTSDGIAYFRRELELKNESVIDLVNINDLKIGEIPEGATSYDINMDGDSSISTTIDDNSNIVINIMSKDAGSETTITIWYWIDALDITSEVEKVDSTNRQIRYNVNYEIYNELQNTSIDDADLFLDLGLGDIEDYIVDEEFEVNAPRYYNHIEEDSFVFNVDELEPRRTLEGDFSFNLEVIDVTQEISDTDRVRLGEEVIENDISVGEATEYSRYYIEPVHLFLKNNLGVTIPEGEIDLEIPLDVIYDDAEEVIIFDEWRDKVYNTSIYSGQEQFNFIKDDGLDYNQEEFSLAYKIPNDEVLLEVKINDLRDNIEDLESQLEIAKDYGLEVETLEEDLEMINDDILGDAEEYLEGEFFEDGYDKVDEGKELFSEVEEELNEMIDDFEDTENKAKLLIDLTESILNRIEETQNAVDEDLINLDRYNRDINNVDYLLEDAKDYLDDKEVEDAIDKAEEAKEEGEVTLNSIHSHIDERVEFEIYNIESILNDLERNIILAEDYGLSVDVSRSNYEDFIIDLDDIEEMRNNDEYKEMMGEIVSLKEDVEDELDVVLNTIEGFGEGRYSEFEDEISDINDLIDDTRSDLNDYSVIFPFNQIEEDYEEWNKILTSNQTELNELERNLDSTKEISEETGDYTYVIEEINSIEDDVNDIYEEVYDINETINNEINEIREEVGSLLDETRDSLDTIERMKDDIEEEEIIQEIESNYDYINYNYNEAQSLYDQGMYYDAKQTIQNPYDLATDLEDKVTDIIGVYDEDAGDSGVETMTSLLLIITVILVIGLFMISKNKKQKQVEDFEGDVRDPYGSQEKYATMGSIKDSDDEF